MNKTFTPVDFDPFEGPELAVAVPLTPPQQEIFVACLLGGEEASLSYNESISVTLNGALHYDRLIQSIHHFIDRHEALRAFFTADGKQMLIAAHMPVLIEEQNISNKTEAEQNDYIKAFQRKDACTPFDLENGPLFRISLLRLAPEKHYLTFTAHHIVCDGWSLGMFLLEVSHLYSQKKLNEAPRYSDFALEQIAYHQSKDYFQTEQYWLSKFSDQVPVLDMPTDFPRPALKTYQSRRDDFLLPAFLVQSLKKTGAKSGCSLVNTLLAAFEIFISQKSRQRDIVVGMPAAGQSATGYFDLVGHCVNLLPLRTTVDPSLSFKAYLKKRKSVFFDDFDHQQITFGSLLQKLNITRDPSRVPLTPVIFNIDMAMNNDVAFEGLSHKVISNPRFFENFELFLNATGTEDSLILEWSYNTALFKPETIASYMSEFTSLLEQLTANDETIIGDLDTRIKNESSVLTQWNKATAYSYDKSISAAGLIDKAALTNPSKTALIFQNQSYSYDYLRQASDMLAAHLLNQGLKKGQVAGICMERSADMVIVMLAVQKTGAAYIPLDPVYPADRIAYMLNDAGVEILLTSKGIGENYSANKKIIIDKSFIDQIPASDNPLPVWEVTASDLCYILYTSGSTGLPKGVMVTHHNLVNLLTTLQEKPGISATDRLLAVITISFDMSCFELYLPLITGATVVIADNDEVKDGRRLLDLVEQKNITILQATPATWRMLVESNWTKHFSNLKAITGGEALSKNLADQLLERCGELWNAYGPTETTVYSILTKIEKDQDPITIGKPIGNTQVYILDEHQQPVPIGQAGEIYIGGEGVTLGYLNKPELTNEKFLDYTDSVKNSPTKKIYRTGDTGYFLPAGDIVCQGRADAQIKIRGYRIEPGEVEFHLLKCAGVKDAAVVAREDNFGFHKMVAYIVLKDELSTTDRHYPAFAAQETILRWKTPLQQALPSYMIPAEFVLLRSMPLTANQKVDRKALPWPVEALASAKATTKISPATDTEKKLAAIWSELLGKNPGITDDFFALGGHSLIAVQVMSRIEKEFGKRLPITTLFEHPTISKLASLLEDDNASTDIWSSYVPIKPDGNKPPLYIIHGAGLSVMLFNPLAQSMCPQQPVFGLQAKGLDGEETPHQSIEEMAAHYIKEIVQRNPEGPYALAGYSLGGLIVFEMAKQLKNMGKKVMVVAMLDASAIQSDRHLPLSKKIGLRLYHLANRVWYTVKLMARHPLFITRLRMRSFYRRIVWWVTGDKAVFQQDITVPEFYRNAKNVFESTDIAFHRYRLQAEKIDIHLFRAKNQWTYRRELGSKTLGWDEFAKGTITLHEVPGDHDHLFREPDVKYLAKKLQECLDTEAQRHKKPLTKSKLYTV